MAPTTDAPKLLKNRKLGKGKKKAWRVANVGQLHDFLDDERRQLESGGLVSEKSDDKLFTIDTKKAQKKPVSVKRLASRKEHFRNKPLRSCAILKPSPHIESAVKPLPENFKKGKKSLKILEHLQEKIASKESVIAVHRERDNAKRASKRRKELSFEATNDIWNAGENTVKVKVYRPEKLQERKPSKLSATMIPHPGASVNPSYDDHQDLLRKAVETEETKKRKAIRIANCLNPRVPRSQIATPATHFAEMAEGLVDETESESEAEEKKEDDAEDSETETPVVEPKRKSKQQKRHELNLKEQMKQKKAEAERKKQENMVERVRILKREIRQQEEKEKARVEAKLKLKEEAPYKTRRLGKLRYEEPAADLKLSEELVAHMRQVKPEGHVLKDVYTSMLKRNIMEPRVKQPKQRKARKMYIKKSHRDP